ncbi:Carbamoyl-phosphate synthase large chain [uncultured Prevotella sp.]|uniref:ATP-grasp domain-containing protein n=1 Tax=uncultured Prevotella sp. TaxID=159272 RepID=UPI001A3A3C33|nr:ATP-grasp domain-containing protein [uncultured Prevotella sp.]VTY03401.1 Carbamoyl-phosphate synthase large chain [uncultured Prevotella sp.]
MKRLMLLGGIRYLLPVIKAAHHHGYYVITVDYVPDNIAHKYSDEFYNVSILDKDAVLKLAQELKIDGILSFGVDPGVITAAFVAEKMNLPFQCSYKSACILQDKSLFRQFLKDNNFNVPNAKGYSSKEDALADTDYFNWPIIVKPVDSAGSKGVTRIDLKEQLSSAIDYALNESHNGHIIIEDFLEKVGNSSDCDSFTVDGKLVFCSFNDQLFDNKAINPYTPAAYTWPSTIPQWAQDELKSELQRLMTLLNVKTGVYNIETRLCKNGKPYIMEVSPRGGGNRLSEMMKYISGQDLIDNCVRAAVGEPIDTISQPKNNGYWAEVILHSECNGIFQTINIDKSTENKYLVEKDIWVKEGDKVQGFTGANTTIGTLVLRFKKERELIKFIKNINKWITIQNI